MAEYGLIEKSTMQSIADQTRRLSGSTGTMTPKEVVEVLEALTPNEADQTTTYLLVSDDGAEVPAVLVNEETVFTATANDIRLGTVAGTEEGVTVGTKYIPAYYTAEGFKFVPSGSAFSITLEDCEYTNLQVIICAFNTTMSNSVAAEKVSVNSKVYPVGSTEELSAVTVDSANKQINLGITNEGDTPCVIRYFSYREEY